MIAPRIEDYPSIVYIGVAKIPYKVKIIADKRKKWLGKCDSGKQTIKLNLALIKSKEELLSTMIHEVLHAIEFESGELIKHEIIHRFEEGLLSFCLNNVSTINFLRSQNEETKMG